MKFLLLLQILDYEQTIREVIVSGVVFSPCPCCLKRTPDRRLNFLFQFSFSKSPLVKRKISRASTMHPGNFLGWASWTDSLSPPMHTVMSRDQFNSIRMRENLVVNYKTKKIFL